MDVGIAVHQIDAALGAGPVHRLKSIGASSLSLDRCDSHQFPKPDHDLSISGEEGKHFRIAVNRLGGQASVNCG